MDPLSMTASIIAILELATTFTTYFNDVRNATQEQAKVAVEASNLYSLLTGLRFRVEAAQASDPWYNQVKLLGQENGPLDQFKEVLEKMVRHISGARKHDQVKSALKWKFTKTQVDDASKRMERLKSLVQCALTEDLFTLSQAIHNGVGTLGRQMEQLHIRTRRLQSRADQELQCRLAEWLGIPDPSTNYQAALQRRHPDTGLWLVNGPQFEDWKSSDSSLMWLHGNAGCGKTVLSAAALQEVLQLRHSYSDLAVGYFYFDFNDINKQSSKKALRSILFQVAQHTSDGLQRLQQLYQRCSNGQQQPSEDAIRLLLRDTFNLVGFKFVVLDALDECADREELLEFLCGLVDLKLTGLRLLATSRRERDIEELLEPIAKYNINIQSKAVDEDIRVYVQSRLATDPKLKKWPSNFRDEITTVVMEKANGMFRWVYCQLDSIRQCVRLKTLREALSSLPKTLDETYNRILLELASKGQLCDAITVLRWLCFSNRPLHLLEACEVLAIENGINGGFFPEERLPDPMDILTVCSSLISCNTAADHECNNEEDDDNDAADLLLNKTSNLPSPTKQIQLAHFSVKEYLTSNRCTHRPDFQVRACHQLIGEGCLRYLLHVFEHEPLTWQVIIQHPLAQYAAENWWRHIYFAKGTLDGTVVDLAARLLVDKRTLQSWAQLYNLDSPHKEPQLSLTAKELPDPLYYAAYIGEPEVFEKVLAQCPNVSVQGGFLGSALQVALVRGHHTVAQMLLNAGVDVNAQGGYNGNVLQAASYYGHIDIAQRLLIDGADVNAVGGCWLTALNAASSKGDERIIKVLLDAGARLGLQGESSALHEASAYGHVKVAQILLAAGADVNAQGGVYGTPLQAATFGGYCELVDILLRAEANVNARSRILGDALQAAAYGGHKRVVQTLLDSGADIHTRQGRFGNALPAASWYGHEEVVQMLLGHGVDVNAQGGTYGNALQAAAYTGHDSVVQILLNAGARVDAQGGQFGSALQAASEGGHEKIVQLLLRTGASMQSEGPKHVSALQAASSGGNESVVNLLLNSGAQVNDQGGDYGHALQAASASGNSKVVRILLNAGAMVDAQGGRYGNALQAASAYGYHKVVQILLEAGAEVNAKGGYYSNALQAALSGGHEKVVQMLRVAGA